jgi:hypothetical protein
MPSYSSFFARRRAAWSVVVPLAMLAVVAGCVYDGGDRCGPNQVLVSADRCACEPGMVPVAIGCGPCGEYEVADDDACVCEEGYVRAEETGPCVPDLPGLGVACDESTPCVTEPFTHCQISAAGGYCTSSGCADTSECSAGYACDATATPPYCQRPPTGQGVSCTAQEDCASYEATYCETAQGQVCLVQGCEVGGSDCFSGWQCCDLSAFGYPTLCVPEGTCPTG